MPCWQSNTIAVDIANADRDLLLEALSELGLGRYAEVSPTGVKISARMQGRIAEIKRKYAGKVVKKAAKRLGWEVKETTTDKFKLTRR